MPANTNEAITRRYLQAMRAVIASNVGGVKTKEDFADKVDVMPQRIHSLEKRDGIATSEQLARICTEFNVSATWLLTAKGAMFAGKKSPDRMTELESRVTALESQSFKRPLKKK